MSQPLTNPQEIEVNRVTADEVKERVERGEPIAFVDSRSDHAWDESNSQIAGSIRVPPDRIDEFVSSVPLNRSVVTYCT